MRLNLIRKRYNRNPVDRFWSKVNKDAPNGCWEWTGTCHVSGYGGITFDHKQLKAHRVAGVL